MIYNKKNKKKKKIFNFSLLMHPIFGLTAALKAKNCHYDAKLGLNAGKIKIHGLSET